jgi:hypothetical protein
LSLKRRENKKEGEKGNKGDKENVEGRQKSRQAGMQVGGE